MNPTATPHFNAATLLVIAFVCWRVYKRVRRLVGRQVLRPWRAWAAVVLFPLLLILLGTGALMAPGGTEALLGLAGGVLVGAGLGVYGHRLTRFEITPEGRFYTPNAHLGLALSLLFIARIGYRFVQMYAFGDGLPDGQAAFARSPLTLAVFGLMAGYYVCYAAGLLRWRAATPAA